MSSVAAFAFQPKYYHGMAYEYAFLKQTDISFVFSMSDQRVFGTAAWTQVFPESKKVEDFFCVIIDIDTKINYHKIMVGLWNFHKRIWIWRRVICGTDWLLHFYFTIKKAPDKRA